MHENCTNNYEKKSIELGSGKVRLTELKIGQVVPISEDLFNVVGLSELSTEKALARFYELLNYDANEAVKYACYHCDLRRQVAKERIKRFIIMDLFIRTCFSNDEEFIADTFIFNGAWLNDLDQTFFSKSELIEISYQTIIELCRT